MAFFFPLFLNVISLTSDAKHLVLSPRKLLETLVSSHLSTGWADVCLHLYCVMVWEAVFCYRSQLDPSRNVACVILDVHKWDILSYSIFDYFLISLIGPPQPNFAGLSVLFDTHTCKKSIFFPVPMHLNTKIETTSVEQASMLVNRASETLTLLIALQTWKNIQRAILNTPVSPARRLLDSLPSGGLALAVRYALTSPPAICPRPRQHQHQQSSTNRQQARGQLALLSPDSGRKQTQKR